jgi:hypothetical protein
MLGPRSNLLVRNTILTIWLLHYGVTRRKGVHYLGESSGPPSMPRAEPGIHGLTSWGRNLSRKVRETRSSSSQKRPRARKAQKTAMRFWGRECERAPHACSRYCEFVGYI